jgi:chemotaxis protein CheZ
MTKTIMPHLSLIQAKALVAHLEADEISEANKIIESIHVPEATEKVMFEQIGELTRELHQSLMSFHQDTRLVDMAGQELPDAKNRLNYVIEMTEKAANTTMDAVEHCLPIADKLINDLAAVTPSWESLMTRNLVVGEFKVLCHSIDDFFTHSKLSTVELRDKLTQILMAQEFQDITGQIINKVIDLVQEIESKLVLILKVRGQQTQVVSKPSEQKKEKDITAEGPIVDANSRSDVVNGQDDVDDLLSSLGF